MTIPTKKLKNGFEIPVYGLGALNWKMEDEDIERLDKDYLNQEDISDTVPLH